MRRIESVMADISERTFRRLAAVRGRAASKYPNLTFCEISQMDIACNWIMVHFGERSIPILGEHISDDGSIDANVLMTMEQCK